MYSITDFWEVSLRSEGKLNEMARSMAIAIVHRAQDVSGVRSGPQAGILLGHQPMVSSSGRFVIAFNGEIYKNLELWAELDNNSNPGAYQGAAGAKLDCPDSCHLG